MAVFKNFWNFIQDKMLGTGDRDSREAIEITNECVREWFDAYVKGDGSVTPHIKAEY